MRNEVHLKMHVSMATPHMIFKNGVSLQIQSYIGFYLSQSTKIGFKLKLRHMSFFPVVRYVNLFICIFMNINENLKIK